MELATRPLITAGVALLGAGVIAVTPMAAPLPDVEVRAVQLTDSPAGIDPITALEDVFKLAVTNYASIVNHFAPAPLPTLQQIIADPGSFDLDKAVTASITPFLPAAPPGGMMPPDFLYPSLTGLHVIGYSVILSDLMKNDPDLVSLLQFSASPLSSVLLGDLGPILDPGLALENSIQDALTAPDPTSAINDLLNIPANIADATLNGAFLDGTTPEIDLSSLEPLLSPLLPTGTMINSLDLVLGGLLSPGGSLLNAIGVGITGLPTITGTGVGPIASLIELDQAIAAALGFNFNDLPAMTDLSTLSTSVDDLLSSLTSSLGGDLSETVAGGVSSELGTLSTDVLTGLANLL